MDWESFNERRGPAWYEDAKLGIMIHWGPYSMWYADSMVIPDSPTQAHHRATWGRLTRYEAFGRAFRQGVKKWDPAAWIDPIVSSGARYLVFTAKHHDGFLMWPARRRNPRRRGWQLSRDVVGEIASAARGRGLRFGVYYSGGLDWTFGGAPIRSLPDLVSTTPRSRGYAAYVDAHWRELISRYAPSILWNDIGSPWGEDLLELFSTYYESVPDGVINDRFGQSDLGEPASMPRRVVMALLKLIAPRIARQPARAPGAPAARHADFSTVENTATPRDGSGAWECVRGLGCSFGFSSAESDDNLLTVPALVRLLVDVVARGGNLLLGVGPSGDGSLPEAQCARLRGLGEWLKLNGEAIFGSRPWGEGEGLTADGMEVRYTCRGMTTYAILMGTPAGRTIVLPSLRFLPYAGLRILGSIGYVAWFQEGKDIHIRLTEPLRESPAHVISITPQPRG